MDWRYIENFRSNITGRMPKGYNSDRLKHLYQCNEYKLCGHEYIYFSRDSHVALIEQNEFHLLRITHWVNSETIGALWAGGETR